MMTPNATNPLITEQGFENVFRFCGRDDLQGAMAGTYLADRWAGKKHRDRARRAGLRPRLAEEARQGAARARGVSPVLFEAHHTGPSRLF